MAANTFAYRCTDQKRLTETLDPIGPDNDKHIMDMAKKAGIVVFAYGKPRHSQLRSRGAVLARILIEKAGITPHTLRLGKDGTPVIRCTSPKHSNPLSGNPSPCELSFRLAARSTFSVSVKSRRMRHNGFHQKYLPEAQM